MLDPIDALDVGFGRLLQAVIVAAREYGDHRDAREGVYRSLRAGLRRIDLIARWRLLGELAPREQAAIDALHAIADARPESEWMLVTARQLVEASGGRLSPRQALPALWRLHELGVVMVAERRGCGLLVSLGEPRRERGEAAEVVSPARPPGGGAK